MGRSLTGRQGERMTAQHVWPGEPVPVPRTCACACMSSRNRWNLQRFPAHASEREIEDGWPYQRPPPCIRDGLEMLDSSPSWTSCIETEMLDWPSALQFGRLERQLSSLWFMHA
jgi:hypothetical protein